MTRNSGGRGQAIGGGGVKLNWSPCNGQSTRGERRAPAACDDNGAKKTAGTLPRPSYRRLNWNCLEDSAGPAGSHAEFVVDGRAACSSGRVRGHWICSSRSGFVRRKTGFGPRSPSQVSMSTISRSGSHTVPSSTSLRTMRAVDANMGVSRPSSTPAYRVGGPDDSEGAAPEEDHAPYAQPWWKAGGAGSRDAGTLLRGGHGGADPLRGTLTMQSGSPEYRRTRPDRICTSAPGAMREGLAYARRATRVQLVVARR